ncbi:MAG: Flp pilus assembly complex ATPase component TadA [Pirellulales bacterium]|nr:Flp pilus assembly complex ATPase component TadA [Pirellulales bacterium]
MAFRRIGQILVDQGSMTDEQLVEVLNEQKNRPSILLGKLAEEMGIVTDDQVAQALAEQMSMQAITLGDTVIAPDVLALITEPMAQLYRIIPISFKDNTLTIAMCDPQKLSILDELRTFLGYEVRAVVTTERDILKSLDRYYAASSESVESIVADMEDDSELAQAAAAVGKEGAIDLTSVEALADSAPVRKLLNMVLLLAIKDRASDIHFEPYEDEFRIRIKADGVLYEMVPPPKHLAFAITTRIKVMANLDIGERRMPQDGRIELTVGGHPVDMRVSVLPTMFGESVVLRILDRSIVELDLKKIGLSRAALQLFQEVIRYPNGVVLVTGPTGSGKTTTLYAALSELNTIDEKLITTEDPVEYDIDGIVQVPIDSSIDVTFASCLRAILRQDPDRILVGEIRDLETAEIAVQAALTGHLVFSTLHTNDAPATVTRMRNMGVPAFLLAATVQAVLAQRLVRRICPQCKTETSPSPEMLMKLELSSADVADKKFYRGRGCDHCNNTGYRGRTGLFEFLKMTDRLKDMVINNASTDELREVARTEGMISLRDAGYEAIFDGRTTVDEIVRETATD